MKEPGGLRRETLGTCRRSNKTGKQKYQKDSTKLLKMWASEWSHNNNDLKPNNLPTHKKRVKEFNA